MSDADQTIIINRALPLYRKVLAQLPEGSKVARDFRRLMEVVEEDSGGVLSGRVRQRMGSPENVMDAPDDVDTAIKMFDAAVAFEAEHGRLPKEIRVSPTFLDLWPWYMASEPLFNGIPLVRRDATP